MRVDKTKIWFIRPMRRHTEARQRGACKRAALELGWTPDACVEYVVGKNCNTWMDCAKARVKGDTVIVEALSLLAEPKSDDVPFPSMNMVEAVETFERKGCAAIIEAHTMRSTAKLDERKAAFVDATKALGQGRALPSSVARENGKTGGPRPKVFSDAEIDKARRVWESRKLKRYKDVAEKLPKGFSVSRAFRMFGPRG